jgi:membrane-bound metal-dependent hydrolase YbcI (DUF457 family)
MFIGHFGIGMAAKKAAPDVNLGFLFLACQLLDLVWPVLVLAGVERVSVDPAATRVTPLDFSHYPYSHSLLMTLIYSFIAAAFAWRFYKSPKAGWITGLVVASHWILDFVAHRADLPLTFGDQKYGLGLWNSLPGTLALETGIFILGIILYVQTSPLAGRKRALTFWSMIGFLILIYAANIWGPKPPVDAPPAAIAGPALAMWLIVIWGHFSDRTTT